MEIKGRDLLKEWNQKKGTAYTVGSEENPSGRTREIQRNVEQEGDCFIDYFTKLLNDETKTDDPESYFGWLGTEYREFKKQWELDQKKAGDADVGTLSLLSKELIKLIGTELAQEVETKVQTQIDAYVQDKVITKIVKLGDLPEKKIEGVCHERLKDVIQFVAMEEPVMLVGPAGSGKNVICKQVADALGLDFYFSNAVTQEYQLTGFVDAMGNYQGTQFYDAFTKGGLFFLDEIDASIPEVLIKLNSAIANGYFDFPKFGRVQAHKDFRVIACANTYGTGASMEYVGRNQLDGASIDRFAVIEINYDRQIEEALCGENKDVLHFCRFFRDVANKNGCHVIVSYREISRLHKMIDIANMDIKNALKSCVIKGIEKDTLRMIASQMPDIEYKKYLNEIINN